MALNAWGTLTALRSSRLASRCPSSSYARARRRRICRGSGLRRLKNSFRMGLPQILRTCCSSTRIPRYSKIDVSFEATIDSHDTSQCTTPATIFALSHHLTQQLQCDLQTTRSTARLTCCAGHKKHMDISKCCACHTKCQSS